ncbi:hypothetical protein Ahia01_000507600 [Argonauta hians]
MTAIAKYPKPETLIITTNGGSNGAVRRAAIVASKTVASNIGQHRPSTSVITVKPVVKAGPNVCKISSNVTSLFTSLLTPKPQPQQATPLKPVSTQVSQKLQTDQKILLNPQIISSLPTPENINTFRFASTDDDDTSSSSSGSAPRKRRRLTHLSPEEKIQRRKLKNRVAAQTARDRKKAQVSDMEIAIEKLQAENRRLVQQNMALQKQTGALSSENKELRTRLCQLEDGTCSSRVNNAVTSPSTTTTTTSSSSPTLSSSSTTPYSSLLSSSASSSSTDNSASNSVFKSESLLSPVKSETRCLRSAAETRLDPVSPDDTLQLFDNTDEPSKLWGFLDEVCKSETEDSESTSQSLSDSSPLGVDDLLPSEDSNPVVGATPTQLDTINELIKFEHFYVKPCLETLPASGDVHMTSMDDDDTTATPTLPPSSSNGSVKGVVVPDISDMAEDNSSSSSGSVDGDFDPLALLEDLLQESVSKRVEDPETNMQLVDLEQFETCDMKPEDEEEEEEITSLIGYTDSDSKKSQVPFETMTTGTFTTDQLSDSASDSGINSGSSNPGSPYQEQLMSIPFEDMDPMDDCLLPEIFPCLV